MSLLATPDCERFDKVGAVRFGRNQPALAAGGSKPPMEKSTIAVFVTIAFSVVGVLGDYFLKLASERERPLGSVWFYVGFTLYASTAFGWVYVMRHLKLATIGVLYSVLMILLLTTVGVVMFRESLNYFEWAGIILAIAALVLLMRFA